MINDQMALQNYGSDLMKKTLFQALVFGISTDVELIKRTFDIKYKISQYFLAYIVLWRTCGVLVRTLDSGAKSPEFEP